MQLRILWLIILVLVPIACTAHDRVPVLRTQVKVNLTERAAAIWSSASHESDFAAIQGRRPDCEISQPPEPLATPNPQIMDGTIDVTVSVIVGTDGLVHSPLVLESGDWNEDQAVLEAVRAWRYRPARCNGVAVESEADIRFFTRRGFE